MSLWPGPLLRRVSGACLMASVFWLGMASTAWAQALRDPTVAPAAAGVASPDGPQRDDPVKTGHISVLKREGVHYLMIGTRLYGVGQRIGQARIERIRETEIWLREDGQLQKIQVFSGVQRRAAAPPLTPTTPAVAPLVVRPVPTMP